MTTASTIMHCELTLRKIKRSFKRKANTLVGSTLSAATESSDEIVVYEESNVSLN